MHVLLWEVVSIHLDLQVTGATALTLRGVPAATEPATLATAILIMQLCIAVL